MFVAFCYLVLRRLLQLVAFRVRSNEWKELEIVVLRHELAVLRRQTFRAPQANGVAERFVRTARSECLDWMLILNQQHLERVLDVFVTHYNEHRPHRGLSLVPPEPRRSSVASAAADVRVHRRDRLGGVVHEYVLAA